MSDSNERPFAATILVVDDGQVTRMRLEHLLKRTGYRVVLAADGQEAIAACLQNIDLLITDIQMPIMNGFDAVRHIRNSLKLSELPIVMMTSSNDREQVLAAFDCGANDYVAKPIDNEVLLARIQNQLLLRRQRIELAKQNDRLAEEIEERRLAQREKDRLHQELMDASHQAGMAEIANGVLHNVGNVVNSMNVSTAYLLNRLRSSTLERLERLVQLLEAPEESASRALAADEKGKQVPLFLRQLTERLQEEHQSAYEEVESMREHVNHVSEIIAMQQSYANVDGLVEEVSLNELCEHAVKINAAGLDRHGVNLTMNLADMPTAKTEKHKVLQILVNFVSNAKYAVSARHDLDKQVSISTRQESDQLVIEVADNGVGVSKEDRDKMFRHGFTTRKDGNGFGLHSSILAAREVGGDITFESAGEGQGATFQLTLPLSTTDQPHQTRPHQTNLAKSRTRPSNTSTTSTPTPPQMPATL